jgi:hypothetical protein
VNNTLPLNISARYDAFEVLRIPFFLQFTVCDTLTDEFDVFDNIVIREFNDIENRRPTDNAESCVQACKSNTNCLSFDIYTLHGNMFCNLAKVTHDMMLDAYRENVINYTPWSKLYTRKCI